jgi:hypothetical protein
LPRTILAIASALLTAMAFFASAAEACISCSYVPPVVDSPSKSYSAERSAPRHERRPREVRESREAKKKPRVTETAKSERNEKSGSEKVEKAAETETAAKSAPAASDAQVENSSFALVTAAHEPSAAKAETADDRGSEHSTIATAGSSRDKAVEAANVDEKVTNVTPASNTVTCSRYFPSAGQTLSVPCGQ